MSIRNLISIIYLGESRPIFDSHLEIMIYDMIQFVLNP